VSAAVVAALVDDLMFLSRLREAARGRAVEIKPVRTAAAAVAAAREGARLVILDLDSPRLPSAETLAALRAEATLASLPIVGFYSHVEAQRGREAARAGCTAVLPRSAFVEKLDALLADAASGSGGSEPALGS
jgi:DNA-binding NarL/FixJ family response regulator